MYIRTEAHMDARTIMHAQVCEKFKVIGEAYGVVSDESSRRKYDMKLRMEGGL